MPSESQVHEISTSIMKAHPRVPESVWLSDAARGLRQQMAFWGRDVRHPEGNRLIHLGMDREPSSGLTGTSCYSAPWEDGRVMLHGAVACWFSNGNPGTIYCRERQKIELWKADQPPIPGPEHGTHGAATEVWMSFQPLLRWLVHYEEALRSRHGAGWRRLSRYSSLLLWLTIPDSVFIRVSFFLAQRPTKADFSPPRRCHSTWRNAPYCDLPNTH
jgi:hypothetical protein